MYDTPEGFQGMTSKGMIPKSKPLKKKNKELDDLEE
jgi:hypothetical protein